MTNRLQMVIKDGTANVYLNGDLVNTIQTKGTIKKADDGNYYRQTMEVIEGVPTTVTSDSLGTSV